MMTLFEVLSHDERIIVFSNEGESMIVTWNRSLTLQAWAQVGSEWEEYGIQTLSREPSNFADARMKAQAWFGNGIQDDR